MMTDSEMKLERVRSVLSTLGRLKSDQIAHLMSDLGIEGKRVTAVDCPIANYVKKTTGETISVCSTFYEFVDEGGGKRIEDMPFSVGRFIRNFDSSIYPFLVSEAAND